MTFEGALQKRNDARARRNGSPLGALMATYDWGFWDAVVTIMKNKRLREIEDKDLGLAESQRRKK